VKNQVGETSNLIVSYDFSRVNKNISDATTSGRIHLYHFIYLSCSHDQNWMALAGNQHWSV